MGEQRISSVAAPGNSYRSIDWRKDSPPGQTARFSNGFPVSTCLLSFVLPGLSLSHQKVCPFPISSLLCEVCVKLTEGRSQSPETISLLSSLFWGTPGMASGALLHSSVKAVWWYLGGLTDPMKVPANLHCMLLQNQMTIYTKFKDNVIYKLTFVALISVLRK